jgi:hypothetical protein
MFSSILIEWLSEIYIILRYLTVLSRGSSESSRRALLVISMVDNYWKSSIAAFSARGSLLRYKICYLDSCFIDTMFIDLLVNLSVDTSTSRRSSFGYRLGIDCVFSSGGISLSICYHLSCDISTSMFLGIYTSCHHHHRGRENKKTFALHT